MHFEKTGERLPCIFLVFILGGSNVMEPFWNTTTRLLNFFQPNKATTVEKRSKYLGFIGTFYTSNSLLYSEVWQRVAWWSLWLSKPSKILSQSKEDMV